MEKELTRIEQLIDVLQETCKSLSEGCNILGFEEEDLSTEELEYLDSTLFLCDHCGWWCEIYEDSGRGEGELICNDCAE